MTNKEYLIKFLNEASEDCLIHFILMNMGCRQCIYDGNNCIEQNASCRDGIKQWLNSERKKSKFEIEPKKEEPIQAEPTANDPVNHPSHYTDGKIEVIDFILDKHLDFCRGNAVKYISRAGKKNPEKEIEDLEKASWYINKEIQRLKGIN